jgi:competence protein ComEA
MLILRGIIASALLLISSIVIASEPININTADANTIAEAMYGVGTKKAKAIVDYRSQHGPFQSLDELLRVRGIGPNTLERSREHITVQETSS